MAKLYPIVKQILEKQFPDEPHKRLGYWSRIANEYARLERNAEIFGFTLPDTQLLDTLLFVRDDLSPDDAILAALLSKFTPEELKSYKETIQTFRIKEG